MKWWMKIDRDDQKIIALIILNLSAYNIFYIYAFIKYIMPSLSIKIDQLLSQTIWFFISQILFWTIGLILFINTSIAEMYMISQMIRDE